MVAPTITIQRGQKMLDRNMPNVFETLISDVCIDESDIAATSDGFFVVEKSIADILSVRNILDFPGAGGSVPPRVSGIRPRCTRRSGDPGRSAGAFFPALPESPAAP